MRQSVGPFKGYQCFCNPKHYKLISDMDFKKTQSFCNRAVQIKQKAICRIIFFDYKPGTTSSKKAFCLTADLSPTHPSSFLDLVVFFLDLLFLFLEGARFFPLTQIFTDHLQIISKCIWHFSKVRFFVCVCVCVVFCSISDIN